MKAPLLLSQPPDSRVAVSSRNQVLHFLAEFCIMVVGLLNKEELNQTIAKQEENPSNEPAAEATEKPIIASLGSSFTS